MLGVPQSIPTPVDCSRLFYTFKEHSVALCTVETFRIISEFWPTRPPHCNPITLLCVWRTEEKLVHEQVSRHRRRQRKNTAPADWCHSRGVCYDAKSPVWLCMASGANLQNDTKWHTSMSPQHLISIGAETVLLLPLKVWICNRGPLRRLIPLCSEATLRRSEQSQALPNSASALE